MSSDIKSTKELREILEKNALEKGYFFNKDRDFVEELLKSLLENFKRYGYSSCPCRLSSGVYLKDEDLICPCAYMEQDVQKYGSCFCALYVSKDIFDGKKEAKPIPESRPKEKVFSFTDKSKKQDNSNTIWKCGVCGYEHVGESAPDRCPKCGASKNVFEKK